MNDDRTPNAGTWIAVGIILLVVLWSAANIIWFFSLPTDGWLTTPPGTYGMVGLTYVENILGEPSALRPGALVVQIEGVPVDNTGQGLLALADKWRVGNRLTYTIQRDANLEEVSVPLVPWQPIPALRYWIEQNGTGIDLAGELVFLAIAALAFFKRPANPAAQTLFFFAALFLVVGPVVKISISSPSAMSNPTISLTSTLTILVSYTILFPATLLQLALVFPKPKPALHRRPWLAYVPYLVGLGVIPLFALSNGKAGYAWTILSIIGAIAIVVHTAFTTRDALSRTQLRWGLWGFIVAWAMFLTNYLAIFGVISGVWADIARVLSNSAFSVFGVTLAIAILRYRLWDIDVIIRRTLIYGFLTSILALFYFGSVVVLQQLFRALTRQGDDLAIIVSTLAIAGLSVPLRNRIQEIIDRRFYRRKYSAAQVLQAFARTARDEVDLNRLTDELLGVVEETVQPESVSVWLRGGGKR